MHFLCRIYISFTLPGRNNQVYVGKNEKGESLFKSKKDLLWTFSELHGTLTQEENEDLSSLTFSTMYLYTQSQRECIIESQIPEVSCLCPDCKNLELMIDGIQKACGHQTNLQSKCHDLMDKAACNLITESCAEGNSENCPPIDLELIKDCGKITFYKWFKGDKYYEKNFIEKESGEIADKLESCIQDIKMHYCKKKNTKQGI